MIQDKKKYFEQMKKALRAFAKGKDMQIFLFGSAVQRAAFADIDVGVQGHVTEQDVRALKETF